MVDGKKALKTLSKVCCSWLKSIDAIDIVKCSLGYVKGYYLEILQATRKWSMSESMKNTVKTMVFPSDL